jgi:AraC-like DNA-binding protein
VKHLRFIMPTLYGSLVCQMVYEELPPSPPLADAVACYWRFALPPSHRPENMEHAVPPDGTVSLCWLPDGMAVLVGPRVSALRVPVRAGAEYRGVRFLPGAAGPFLQIDVRSARDAVRPYPNEEFAVAMRTEEFAALDKLLLRWAQRIPWQGPDPAVAALARRIVESDGTTQVCAMIEGLGLSYRQVLRRFYEASGLTPKEFARLRRFRAACLQAIQTEDPRWANVSADAGFSDQAHLVREFSDIYGWPPRLAHEYLRRIEHHVSFLQDATGNRG